MTREDIHNDPFSPNRTEATEFLIEDFPTYVNVKGNKSSEETNIKFVFQCCEGLLPRVMRHGLMWMMLMIKVRTCFLRSLSNLAGTVFFHKRIKFINVDMELERNVLFSRFTFVVSRC